MIYFDKTFDFEKEEYEKECFNEFIFITREHTEEGSLENKYCLDYNQEKRLFQNNDFESNSVELISYSKEKNNTEGDIIEKDKNTSSFINKKRKSESTIFEISKQEKCNKSKSISDDQNLIKEDIKKKKKGRKNNLDKEEHPHNRESADNMIRKIKVHLFNKYFIELFNQNLEDKSLKLLKLDHEFIKCLKRSINVELFNKKLNQIFSEIAISDKYIADIYKDYNKILINKIYNGIIKEEKVKKLLDLTFLEILEIFRRKEKKSYENINIIENKLNGVNLLIKNRYEGIESFINNLKSKKGLQKKYLNKLISLVLNYEKWFTDKIGRN